MMLFSKKRNRGRTKCDCRESQAHYRKVRLVFAVLDSTLDNGHRIAEKISTEHKRSRLFAFMLPTCGSA